MESPEVHAHLHCFEHVKLHVVKTAPDSQLLNLLSVSRLVTVLNEADQCGVVCKLQELDRGVFRCIVIRVQGEEQWEENTAQRSSSAVHAGADGVKSGAEVYKQDPHISPWYVQILQDEVQSHVDFIIHRPIWSVGKLQGVQWRPSDKPKPVFQIISWPQTLEPQVCSH